MLYALHASKAMTVVKEKNKRKEDESELDYEMRMLQEAFVKLSNKKKRTKKEEEELEELQTALGSYLLLREGGVPEMHADKDCRSMLVYLHRALSEEHGKDSPEKLILIDRIVSTWSMTITYERLMQLAKYKRKEGGGMSIEYNRDKIELLKETRRGLNAANDQLLRLMQALCDLSAPPINLRATNAFFAQNQQINQHPPKDFDKISDTPKNAENDS